MSATLTACFKKYGISQEWRDKITAMAKQCARAAGTGRKVNCEDEKIAIRWFIKELRDAMKMNTPIEDWPSEKLTRYIIRNRNFRQWHHEWQRAYDGTVDDSCSKVEIEQKLKALRDTGKYPEGSLYLDSEELVRPVCPDR